MSTSDILNFERRDVTMIKLQMGFAVEMLMKNMIENFMPWKRTQNGYHYQLRELFFGVILGFVVVFSGISIYLEVTTGCEDSLITGQKLLTVFGKSSGSGIPIISMDQEGLIVVEGVPKEQMYLWLISDEGSCIAHQQIFMREPLLSHDSGLFFGLSQIASTASVNAISAVANACSNMMRYNYHDFDMTCTRNETPAIWNSTTGRWLESSVALGRVPFLEDNNVHVLDWTLRRVKPCVTRDAEEPLLIAAVSCRIVGAWVTRYESQLRGTLNKTVIRRYDSVESASKENTTDVDPLSNLGRNNVRYLGSSMGYLDLALANTVVGGCLGQMDAMDLPYKCDKSLSLMLLSADPYRVENDVEMMELEMRFTAEMIMKHLFIQVMPEADTTGTCKNCSARNARWGVILGLVMLFAGTSIYLEATHGCRDSLISAEKLFTSFGGTCGSGVSTISLDKHRQTTVDGATQEQSYHIADQ